MRISCYKGACEGTEKTETTVLLLSMLVPMYLLRWIRYSDKVDFVKKVYKLLCFFAFCAIILQK